MIICDLVLFLPDVNEFYSFFFFFEMNTLGRCLSLLLKQRSNFTQSAMFVRTIPWVIHYQSHPIYQNFFRKILSENAHHDKEVQQLYNKVNQLANEKSHHRLFAVIQIGNEQRKVTTEDIICKVDEFHPTVGDRIRFEKVLLVGSSDFTVIGRPILSPHFVRVEGMVIEKTLSQTQMEYWYAPKKKKVGMRHYRN